MSAGDVAEVLAAVLHEHRFAIRYAHGYCACMVPERDPSIGPKAHAAHVAAALAPVIEARVAAAVAGVVARVENELAHAEANGTTLAGQGVGPGEQVPAVRISHVRAALEAASDALRGHQRPSTHERLSGTTGEIPERQGGDSA